MFDHYPFDSVSETELANRVAESMLSAPPPVAPNPTRFRIRYGVAYCLTCGRAAAYCRGHGPLDASQAQDGIAAASLEKRIREAHR